MNDLYAPIFAHLLITSLLYVLLTIARAPKIWGLGKRKDGSNPFEKYEPRISANLSNQFEWPLFFYVGVLISIQLELINVWILIFSWIFIVGRILHSLVQICTSNIKLRGAVFTINFLAILGVWLIIFKTL